MTAETTPAAPHGADSHAPTISISNQSGLPIGPHALRIERVTRYCGLNLEQRLAGGDVERFFVGAAEGEVGDDVFADGDSPAELALRRDYIDAGRHIGRFIGGSRGGNAGSDPQVALRIEAHAVAAAAPAKVEHDALLGDGAVIENVERPNSAAYVGADVVAVDQIQRFAIGGDRQAVGSADRGLRDD